VTPAAITVLAWIALGTVPTFSLAASTVAPISVELLHARQVATVQIFNRESGPIRVQASTFKLRPEAGRSDRVPTTELVVVPALAEVPGGGSQVFRIALRRPEPARVERNYRLLLAELEPAAPPGGSSARFSLVHDLPVSVLPAAATEHRVSWSNCPQPPASTGPMPPNCVQLHNQGNRRIRVASVTLRSGSQTHVVPLNPEVLVLPEGSTAMAATWPRGGPTRSAAVTLTSGVVIEAVEHARP
jgi:fimbrial chaperone protein